MDYKIGDVFRVFGDKGETWLIKIAELSERKVTVHSTRSGFGQQNVNKVFRYQFEYALKIGSIVYQETH